jgi:GTP cyclohydrolase I
MSVLHTVTSTQGRPLSVARTINHRKNKEGLDKMDNKIDTVEMTDLFERSKSSEDTRKDDQVANLTHNLLSALGENPDREGLQRTPQRVARMYEELLAGYNTDLVKLVNDAIFDSDYENMVLVRDIDFFSLCEHHMLPFSGQAHVAYIPNGKIIGLSKIPRLVEMYARRFQVQERMTKQIAATLDTILQPKGVAVVLEGVHMCSVMRGVKKINASMVTSAVLGEFKQNGTLLDEFMALINKGDNTTKFSI